MAAKVKITGFGLNSNDPNQLVTTWYWNNANTKEFAVRWYYSIKFTKNNKITWEYTQSTVPYGGKSFTSKYSIPSDCLEVKCAILPISKTYKENDKEVRYWTADWQWTKVFNNGIKKPDRPSDTPTIGLVTDDSYTARVEVSENITGNVNRITKVQFCYFYKRNKTWYTKAPAAISLQQHGPNTGMAQLKIPMSVGDIQNVCYRLVDIEGNVSEWSDCTGDPINRPNGYIYAKPIPVTNFTPLISSYDSQEHTASIKLSWKFSGGYVPNNIDIEYITVEDVINEPNENEIIRLFNIKNDNEQVQKRTIDHWVTETEFTNVGINAGYRIYFRIRLRETRGIHTGRTSDEVYSNWRYTTVMIKGDPPSPPSIWSTKENVLLTNDPIDLCWSHNSANDGIEDKATIRFNFKTNAYDYTYDLTISNIHRYNGNHRRIQLHSILDLIWLSNDISSYNENEPVVWTYVSGDDTIEQSVSDCIISWKVKTKNSYSNYSQWSDVKRINAYIPPTSSISISSLDENFNIFSYPIDISIFSTYNGVQKPISHYISIKALNDYDSVDYDGIKRNVSKDDVIYEKTIIPTETEMSDGHSGFVNLTEYSYSLNPSDLILENGKNYLLSCDTTFNSGLTDYTTITFTTAFGDDDINVFASCSEVDNAMMYIKPFVGKSQISVEAQELIDELSSLMMDDLHEARRDELLSELDALDEEDILEPIDNETDYVLSVYRQNTDGTFILLESDIPAGEGHNVLDPHPNIGKVIYRIVGISNITGQVFYNDVEDYIHENAIIINWDERVSIFESNNDNLADQPYSGNILRLPYDIEISDNHSNDVSFVEYIGRENPVTYYGTQKSHTSTWNTKIPKDDTDTLAIIRRLAEYSGDCYVREPSGSGYWANIKVSYSQKYDDLTIPISLSVTRVEGGK